MSIRASSRQLFPHKLCGRGSETARSKPRAMEPPASDIPPKSPQQQVLVGEAGFDVAEQKCPIEAPSNEASTGDTQLKLDNTSLPHRNISSIQAPKSHRLLHKTEQIGRLDSLLRVSSYFNPSTQCFETLLDRAPAEKRVGLRGQRRWRRMKQARR